MKTLIFTIFLIILLIGAGIQDSKNKANLERQNATYKKAAMQYGQMPGWLVLSWEKCSSDQVPENFRKECVCYEIQRQN